MNFHHFGRFVVGWSQGDSPRQKDVTHLVADTVNRIEAADVIQTFGHTANFFQ